MRRQIEALSLKNALYSRFIGHDHASASHRVDASNVLFCVDGLSGFQA